MSCMFNAKVLYSFRLGLSRLNKSIENDILGKSPYFKKSESIEHCFLNSGWLKYGTLIEIKIKCCFCSRNVCVVELIHFTLVYDS